MALACDGIVGKLEGQRWVVVLMLGLPLLRLRLKRMMTAAVPSPEEAPLVHPQRDPAVGRR